jgi:Uma2 family endonuclease
MVHSPPMTQLGTARLRKRAQRAWQTLSRRLFTREEYYRLAEIGILREDERVELIEGEIVQMVPIGPEHVATTHSLYDRLCRVFGKGYVVRMQAPLSLGDSEPQPNLAVVAGSPSDFPACLYARAGIPDYWVLDIENRRLEVYRDPAESLDAPFGYAYRTRLVLSPRDTIAPLSRPECALRIRRLLEEP